MKQRFIDMYAAYQSYQEGTWFTSLGVRFDLWQSSLRAFDERPFLGLSPRGFKRLARNGQCSGSQTVLDSLRPLS